MLNSIRKAGDVGGLSPSHTRLWSLWDMLKENAVAYIQLGQRVEAGRATFIFKQALDDALSSQDKDSLRQDLIAIWDLCHKLALPISGDLLSSRASDPATIPKTVGEYDILIDAVYAELKSKLFLFVPQHRAKYYEVILPSIVTVAFPSASKELVTAGNALACGLYTACVFHVMRGGEIGIRALAATLDVRFDYPIELAEWGKIAEQIERKINELKAGARSAQKDADLKFYSEAAAQFRHFNNGWRIRVSHAREEYEEHQAREIFDHVTSFFLTLAARLKEVGT